MATTPRKPSAGPFTLLPLALVGLLQQAWAQTAIAPSSPLEETEPATTVQPAVQPFVNAQLLSTDNALATVSPEKRSDVVLSVSPGVAIRHRGGNTQIDGRWQFNAIHYHQGSQQDRIQPAGDITLRTDVAGKGIGLDARLASEQVRNTLASSASISPQTTETYTNTLFSLTPFIRRQLDPETEFEARVGRTWLRIKEDRTSATRRPDSDLTAAELRLHRQPTRLGYELDFSDQRTKVDGQSDNALVLTRGTASLLYRLFTELEIGGIVGHENTKVLTSDVSDSVSGVRWRWQPTERTHFDGQLTHHFYGQGWRIDATHRAPWLALGLFSRRSIETYASSLATLQAGGSIRTALGNILTTRVPNPAERDAAVDAIMRNNALPETVQTARDLYSLNASLRQDAGGQLTLLGRRDIVLFSSGYARSMPINGLEALLPVNAVKEYYFDTQISHRLTPESTLTGGLRWTRTYTTLTNQDTRRGRDFSWNAAFNQQLNPRTTTTIGLRRLITHNPLAINTRGETAVFVGVGHRF